MSKIAERSEYEIWAEAELRRAGFFSPDSDYDGMLGPSVMKLVEAHAGEGHSGFSAAYSAHLFAKLAAREALTPLTDDPAEWMHIAKEMAGMSNLWQSRRQSSCFSNDGGKTYYDIDEPESRWRKFRRRHLKGPSTPPTHRTAKHDAGAPPFSPFPAEEG